MNTDYQKLYKELMLKHAIELLLLEIDFERKNNNNYNTDFTILKNSLHETYNYTNSDFDYIIKKVDEKTKLKS